MIWVIMGIKAENVIIVKMVIMIIIIKGNKSENVKNIFTYNTNGNNVNNVRVYRYRLQGLSPPVVCNTTPTLI